MTNMTIRYIDEKTAQVTKTFQKNASIFGTDEFKLWREYKKEFPAAVMVTKKIKTNPDKLNITKNMTYENMALYIREQEDAEAVMAEFKKQIKLSKVKANPYRAVLAWFKQKYTNVNDYMDYFENRHFFCPARTQFQHPLIDFHGNAARVSNNHRLASQQIFSVIFVVIENVAHQGIDGFIIAQQCFHLSQLLFALLLEQFNDRVYPTVQSVS